MIVDIKAKMEPLHNYNHLGPSLTHITENHLSFTGIVTSWEQNLKLLTTVLLTR